MPITTLKVLASVLQLHGPGATIQSDHQGIDAVLNDLRGQDAQATEVYFRRGGLSGRRLRRRLPPGRIWLRWRRIPPRRVHPVLGFSS